MCDALNDYLGKTFQRDKAIAIVQFLSMTLVDPVKSVGCPQLAHHLAALATMTDRYRAITRLSLLFDALGKRTLTALATPSGSVVEDRLHQLAHFSHTFYCIFENTAVLASHDVYSKALSRLGGCAVTCWFYTLLFNLVNTIYVLTQKKLSEAKKRDYTMALVKLSCFFVFSMSCIPKGGPMLLEDVSGPLAPLHHIIRAIAPRHLALPDTVRGALGLIASTCDLYS